MSVFDGQPLANTWRITASDRASNDTGTLTEWCLIATYGSAVPADYSDLPDSYGVAWHTGAGAIRLGSQWTADSSFAADGDNTSDDGVSFIGAIPGRAAGHGAGQRPGDTGCRPVAASLVRLGRGRRLCPR